MSVRYTIPAVASVTLVLTYGCDDELLGDDSDELLAGDACFQLEVCLGPDFFTYYDSYRECVDYVTLDIAAYDDLGAACGDVIRDFWECVRDLPCSQMVSQCDDILLNDFPGYCLE